MPTAAGLCRPRWHRHQTGRARAVVAPPSSPRHVRDAARGAAAAHQPFRIAARAQPRALSKARAGRRGEISHLDRRQFIAASGLRRPARGQAGGRSALFTAASESMMERVPFAVATRPEILIGGQSPKSLARPRARVSKNRDGYEVRFWKIAGRLSHFLGVRSASANSAYGTIPSSWRCCSASRCSSSWVRSVNRRPQN
jgi:hypothetical protein